MERSETVRLSDVREWVIYRTLTTRHVYTGIKASSREEALEKWRRGEGAMQDDRTQHLEPQVDAVDVKARP